MYHFVLFLNPRTTQNNKIDHFVLIFTISGGKFIISDSKFIVLCYFIDNLDIKPINIPINLSFITVFQVKIQHKTINLLFCVVFASIKLLQYNIPEINYRLNDKIFFL